MPHTAHGGFSASSVSVSGSVIDLLGVIGELRGVPGHDQTSRDGQRPRHLPVDLVVAAGTDVQQVVEGVGPALTAELAVMGIGLGLVPTSAAVAHHLASIAGSLVDEVHLRPIVRLVLLSFDRAALHSSSITKRSMATSASFSLWTRS